MNKLVKLLLPVLVIAAVPLSATLSGPGVPHKLPPPGDGGGGGEACVSTSCAFQCPDGSWASHACSSTENAYCVCDGRSEGRPLDARTFCTPCHN